MSKEKTFYLKIKVKDIDLNGDDEFLEKDSHRIIKEYTKDLINEKMKEFYDLEILEVEVVDTIE